MGNNQPESVYATTERIPCRSTILNLPECLRWFRPERRTHEFCSEKCKNAYHFTARKMGLAGIETLRKEAENR